MDAESLKQRKRELMKKLNDSRRERDIMDMPDGYITATEWALKSGHSARAGRKILYANPNLIPAARKVRNSRGGVDIWAVPTDTIWPF